ncbi:MAG: hypothetical protein FWG55_07200 [Candidatus Bathyarchaeota archaeon]|nr:hypothetical protein [Candidatus Termiticorpusculum sp.]
MTGRLRCYDGRCVERYKVNVPFTAFICVAEKYGVSCPKLVNVGEFGSDCLVECRNPDGKTDFEVYKQ